MTGSQKKSKQELHIVIEQAATARQEKLQSEKFDKIRQNFVKATEFVLDKINEYVSNIDSDSEDETNNPYKYLFKIDWSRKYRGLLYDLNDNFEDDDYWENLTLEDLLRICNSLETFPN